MNLYRQLKLVLFIFAHNLAHLPNLKENYIDYCDYIALMINTISVVTFVSVPIRETTKQFKNIALVEMRIYI